MTDRRKAIIRGIAMGMTRKEIAFSLKCGVKGVEWHCIEIRRKLGFNDPARLTHFAISRKLVKLNQTV